MDHVDLLVHPWRNNPDLFAFAPLLSLIAGAHLCDTLQVAFCVVGLLDDDLLILKVDLSAHTRVGVNALVNRKTSEVHVAPKRKRAPKGPLGSQSAVDQPPDRSLILKHAFSASTRRVASTNTCSRMLSPVFAKGVDWNGRR